MVELFLLMIFNLLYPEKNRIGSPKDDMNTAAAFFYGTSFEPEKKGTAKDPSQSTGSDCHNDFSEDFYDWLG